MLGSDAIIPMVILFFGPWVINKYVSLFPQNEANHNSLFVINVGRLLSVRAQARMRSVLK